jgi:hydrogenase maturation protein HypF
MRSMLSAYSIHVCGIVQGVGFRPFVYRLAHAKGLKGWVLNAEQGVEIHLEGNDQSLHSFIEEMKFHPPQAAEIAEVRVECVRVAGFSEFMIRESTAEQRPTVRVSPDLPVCQDCLRELFDPNDRRFLYPYINCTNCGPRYSVVQSLPYDRPNTTMADWALDRSCASEYRDPANRRFHAQPVACLTCGPNYLFQGEDEVLYGAERSIGKAVQYLQSGKIVAVKGIGGYHLACDAKNVEAVRALRTRKYRKEKPFALMTKDMAAARNLVHLGPQAESLLNSTARPIVLAGARVELPEVAPENDELGVMLPYTPLHHMLFAAGAPEVLVMTSANRSSEPISYKDDDARRQLYGIADGFLIGERPIARRVDDSIARAGVFGPTILRRGRGYAPSAAAALPTDRPILALGADLKNSITLVVHGQAFVSQHIGDLHHYESFGAFQETIQDLLSMYEIDPNELLLVHDAHPQYVSTAHAAMIHASDKRAVQHHRAHIASVLAERGAWNERVVGVSFDGTGYGDDGTIWGGEILVGSLSEGFERVAHLRSAILPGGDAAASHPVQAAAGFLAQLKNLPDLTAPPFSFSSRYTNALQLLSSKVRSFPTTSIGRLFDTAAALLGFTREVTFEGQAAMWLERLASRASKIDTYPFPFVGDELDFRPLLEGVINDRLRNRDKGAIACGFHRAIAQGVRDALIALRREHKVDVIVLSGGVFQNELLLSDVKSVLELENLEIWTNHLVPPNDGGISLGQAAIAVLASRGPFVALKEEKTEEATRVT